MVDLDMLQKRGVTAKDWRSILENYPSLPNSPNPPADTKKTKSEKLDNFLNRLRMRISEARERNINDAPMFHAIDLAFDAPFRQISPSFIEGLMDKGATSQTVTDALKTSGFDISAMAQVPDSKSAGKAINPSELPSLVQITVPLVKAYTTIRHAKLMNDRRLVPFLKFDPAINNGRTRMKCEVVTNRIEVMSRQYDYFGVVSQGELHALKYARCLQFPVEEWHVEEQETENEGDGTYVSREEGKNGDKRRVKVVKEGVRFHTPHPTRAYWDMNHPLRSLLTDTGCEYSGYWRVFRYKDVRSNKGFFNVDRVPIGSTDWWSSPGTTQFFNTVYNSCIISAPRVETVDPNDREQKVVNEYYSTSQDDRSIVLTEHFEKIIPSEVGLGDYDYPIWARFVVAGDNTIVYAAPLPYTPPVLVYLYDNDDTRYKNASLSLEILPFQDQFSNLLTQFLLTVRQNLANLTFVDTDAEGTEKWITTIKGLGTRLWGKLNIFPVSGKKLQKSQHLMGQLVYSHRFPYIDTNGLMLAMKTVLDVLERILVVSSQEVAQAAAHELRAEEVRNITASTSSRLRHTGIPLDAAIECLKRLVYQGTMAYGDDEFYAEVPTDKALSPEDLKDMGITWDEDRHPVEPGTRRIAVKVKRTALMMESFSANRDGNDRVNNTEGGLAMLQTLAQLLNSSLAPNIGPDQFLKMINLSAQMLGYPREFKFDNLMPGEFGGPNQMQEQMGQMVQKLQQSVGQQVQPVAEAVQQLAQSVKAITEGNKLLAQEVERLGQIIDPNAAISPRSANNGEGQSPPELAPSARVLAS